MAPGSYDQGYYGVQFPQVSPVITTGTVNVNYGLQPQAAAPEEPPPQRTAIEQLRDEVDEICALAAI